MKYIFAIAFLFILFPSCEKPGDCVKSAGKTAVKDYDGLVFSKIIVHKGISLIITQGPEFHVQVQTGENLINDIEVNVVNDMLVLEDKTVCNWVRDYGKTMVYVTAPNLTDIYSKTELQIASNGLLTYSNLHLISMDSEDGFDGAGTGDFYLQLNNQHLIIENNNVSRYYIAGHTQNLQLKFYEAGGIFYGQELRAENIDLYHRGSNDLYVHPIQSIAGDLYNVGNVISVNRPPLVNVTEHYHGRLIFY